jgi:hypothetical protein
MEILQPRLNPGRLELVPTSITRFEAEGRLVRIIMHVTKITARTIDLILNLNHHFCWGLSRWLC